MRLERGRRTTRKGAGVTEPASDIRVLKMGRQVGVALYVVAMAAVIVGLDLAFFKNQFWTRLIVNIGVVLAFGGFYVMFLNRP